MNVAQEESVHPDLALAVEVARLHYVAERSKVEIASALGISRFKVARLLELARESGVVQIQVVEPPGMHSGDLMAQRLSRRWGLKECVVVPTDHDVPGARPAVGGAAARLLPGMLAPDDVLGLAWSRSVRDLVDALETLPPVRIIQLSGALAEGTEDSSSVDVVRRASRIAGGGRKVFFAPLVMPDVEAARAVRRDPAVRDTLEAVGEVSVAVLGIGAWSPHSSTIYDEVDDHMRRTIAALGVAGECAGVFFGPDGEVVATPLTERMIALSAQQLAAIPVKLAVAHGPDKVGALAAAMTGGLVNGLVTTRDTAEALLAVP